MTRRGLLITADGLDRAGTGQALELLGRWIERRGQRVEVVQPPPSAIVRRAAGSRRARPFLDPRIAALLAAAELEHGTLATLRSGLARGSVMLVDRYAWTAIARDVARGLDPAWVRRLYRFAPRPDLCVYLRQPAREAVSQSLRDVPADGALAAAAGAFHPFLERVVAELDALAASGERADAEPWPTPSLVLEARPSAAATATAIRQAVKPLQVRPRRRRGAAGGRPADRPSGEDVAEAADRLPPGADRGLPAAAPGRAGEPGRLIVLEGIDHAGRSTHAGLLEQHLRYAGRGVVRTSFGASSIAGEALRRAKSERGWDPVAMLLLYAADLAERLQHVVRPALRAGMTVIADRYAYTPAARAVAQGLDPDWVESLFAFAPPPDVVLFLDLPPSVAIARAAADPGAAARASLDADRLGEYERFQALVAAWFVSASVRLGFVRVAADREQRTVQAGLQRALAALLDRPSPATARP